MRRSISRAGLAALAPALAALLTGCTHIGTNVAGTFSCHSLKAGCEPLSEVDARAIRQLVTAEQADFAVVRQRIGLAAADNARTGERTMRVIFPAHVDGSGTLHEEAVAWTVIEAARWAGELRLREMIKPRGPVHALRQALEDQARRITDMLRATEANANPKPLPPQESVLPEAISPFIPSSPLALPSPGGEGTAGPGTSSATGPVAEGSDMSPTLHVRAPRLEEEPRIWPSAAAIEAATTLDRKAPPARPNKESK